MSDIKRLLTLAGPHAGRIATATFVLLLGTIASLAVPANLGQLLDSAFGGSGGAQLNRVAWTLGLILLFRMATSVVAGYLLEWTGERIVADLRKRLFARLVQLDLSFYHNTRLGEVTSRMTNDVAVIQHAVTSTLAALVEKSLLVMGALTLMVLVNWRLTLALFTTVPLVLLFSRFVGRYVYRLSREVQARLAAANSVMEETLGAIRVVKSFVRESYERQRFDHEIEALFRNVQSRARLGAVYGPVSTMMFMLALVLVLWLGGREVQAGRLSAGQILEFLAYGGLLATSVTVFGTAYSTFKRAIGATERVFELLGKEAEIQSPPDGASHAPLRGEVRFEQVSFGYQEEQPILAEVSFTVAPGEVVALVGVSGIGKSTLLDLIPRFYDVTGGRVLVDGVDVRQWKLPALRAGISSVPQETVLFAATIRDNLRYGRLDASDEELEAAARAANAHSFIEGFPQGYDSLVGERGVKLSGGQRQRIAIARALLKEPAILLLDEATSSLDSESERAVQAALDELLAARGRTTLVVAHRLSTIRNADRIIVLAPVEGVARVVEQGTHEELLARRGVYYHLYRLQFQDGQSAGGADEARQETTPSLVVDLPYGGRG